MKREDIKILVACEESQAVCKAFLDLGFDAYSCDLQPCSGSHPERHLQMDCFKAISLRDWHLVIAHPPCTYLAVCGNRWFKDKDGKVNVSRMQDRLNALEFFGRFLALDVPYVAIENPIGVASTHFRKPDQIIEPWQFGESFSKKTCLWLKNLPKLTPTEIVDKGEIITFGSGKRMPKWYADFYGLPKEERQKMRSKTFKGIARAMAEQWGKYLEENL